MVDKPSYTKPMKITIAKKLALAFLILTLVVLAATLGLARWSFERGFFDYINTLEKARLEAIALTLSAEYQQAGHSWENIEHHHINRLIHQTNRKRHNNGIDRPRGPNPPPPSHHRNPNNGPNLGPPRGPKTSLLSMEGQFIAGDPIEVKPSSASERTLTRRQH